MGSVAACRRVFVSMCDQWNGLRIRRSHAKFLPLALESLNEGLCSSTGPTSSSVCSSTITGRCWRQHVRLLLPVFSFLACDIIHSECGQCRRTDVRHSSNTPHRISLLPVNTTSSLCWVEKYPLYSDLQMQTKGRESSRFLTELDLLNSLSHWMFLIY